MLRRCAAPWVLLLSSLFLAGCPKRVSSPTEALDRAAIAAETADATARDLALAGFHAFLPQGEMERAEARFNQSLARDPADPYALFGQLLLARRDGHPDRALVVAFDLCDRAPQHPLSVTAARYVLDMAGTAISTDDVILRRAPVTLEKGAGGDAAYL